MLEMPTDEEIDETIDHLVEDGMVETYTNEKGDRFLRLTPLGRLRVEAILRQN